METRIQKTLRKWFPEAFAEEQRTDSHSDYETLQQFARYTIRLIHDKKNEREPFEIINQLYQKGSLHDRNAIENEFFTELIKTETPGTLKRHLELMPQELKTAYLKTILEN
ncbi:MAG: hypothetical protein AB2L24_04900 [Mangrovibacterium sp.]